ncbi:hypothetical protein B0H13DRAFT_1918272 [Mycena leptocephala]|nr:hypothetical protein B0H13DRAFT_1918272 [Mycena leptocephala]
MEEESGKECERAQTYTQKRGARTNEGMAGQREDTRGDMHRLDESEGGIGRDEDQAKARSRAVSGAGERRSAEGKKSRGNKETQDGRRQRRGRKGDPSEDADANANAGLRRMTGFESGKAQLKLQGKVAVTLHYFGCRPS